MKLSRLFWLIVILLAPLLCWAIEGQQQLSEKPTAYWRERLTKQQFEVCREGGTEPPHSGEYADYKGEGVFVCSSCGQRLFDASAKFDSGTGWPSFSQPISQGAVTLTRDSSLGLSRTEVRCSRCDAHLGHVFSDGPAPTGQRYCMNSVCLQLAE